MSNSHKGKTLSKEHKENNKANNLISLCDNCHGQTNWGRNEWTTYFSRRIVE